VGFLSSNGKEQPSGKNETGEKNTDSTPCQVLGGGALNTGYKVIPEERTKIQHSKYISRTLRN